MATPSGVDINLNDGQPSIEIISKNSSGDYQSKTYLRKECIDKVVGVQSKENLQADGSFTKIRNSIKITMKDSKNWIVYSGHSLVSGRPNAWENNGRLSLVSFDIDTFIS